tara:strand:- start:22 stop:876 length:855 start_codon:yes stop_codon:yes gene_type:complete
VKRLLIIGASGMIGHKLFIYFSKLQNFDTYGIVRKKNILRNNKILNSKKIIEVEILKDYNFKNIIHTISPNIVINCAGIVKQNPLIKNISLTIELNSLFPHNLNLICKKEGCKLIQFSTDCVFSGYKGNYIESDFADSRDIYGRTKFIGEVIDKNCLTIRTSFIGDELNNRWGLLNWFLSQKKTVKGFKNTIYSGLTTLEICRVIEKFVIPNEELNGLYHISSKPIDKFSLLVLIREIYEKDINIEKDILIINDKSLDCQKFKNYTGYEPIEWDKAIRELKNFH